jgi:hypothetical protein
MRQRATAARIPRECARFSSAPASCGLLANITSSGMPLTTRHDRGSRTHADPYARIRLTCTNGAASRTTTAVTETGNADRFAQICVAVCEEAPREDAGVC